MVAWPVSQSVDWSALRCDYRGLVAKKKWLFCLRITTGFRCSIGVTFKTVQRLPAPKPTIFLLTHPKLKNMCFGQGYQNPPNPIRKKSAQLGRGQLPVRRPDQTHQIFGHRMGEDLNRKMDPKKVLKYLMPPYMWGTTRAVQNAVGKCYWVGLHSFQIIWQCFGAKITQRVGMDSARFISCCQNWVVAWQRTKWFWMDP